MDATIRNLDERAYRLLRARAVLEGKPVGELINEAIRAYLARPYAGGSTSLREWKPEPYPDGDEHLSTAIDTIVYR